MSGWYIYENGEAKPCETYLEFEAWAEKLKDTEGRDYRHVAADDLPDGSRLSTCFLALDHSWKGGPPVLWETMIFGGPYDGYQNRYTSEEAAKEGHAAVLAILQRGENPFDQSE